MVTFAEKPNSTQTRQYYARLSRLDRRLVPGEAIILSKPQQTNVVETRMGSLSFCLSLSPSHTHTRPPVYFAEKRTEQQRQLKHSEQFNNSNGGTLQQCRRARHTCTYTLTFTTIVPNNWKA